MCHNKTIAELVLAVDELLKAEPWEYEKCCRCGGSGRIRRPMPPKDSWQVIFDACPSCNGSGLEEPETVSALRRALGRCLEPYINAIDPGE